MFGGGGEASLHTVLSGHNITGILKRGVKGSSVTEKVQNGFEQFEAGT